MSEITSLRAELKQWEHHFRSEEGREPGVKDIKSRPDIVQKYKLYKKLTKAASAQSDLQRNETLPEPPSTPARTSGRPTPHSISAKRVIAPTGPLTTFNPFSPQKAKGKASNPAAPRTPRHPANPFTSPVKSRHRSVQLTLPLPGGNNDSRSSSPSDVSNTISRARKRLRGEPVSPSPNKRKRRKTSPDTNHALSKLVPSIPRDDDAEDDALTGNTSFVDDSPMKIASSARSFILFEENHIPSADIFGLRKKPKPTTGTTQHHEPVSGNSKQDVGFVPSKAKSSKGKDIFPKAGGKQQTLTQFLSAPRKSTNGSGLPQGPSETRSCSPSTGAITPFEEELPTHAQMQRAKSPLLPPSPPPPSTSTAYKNKGKRKADPNSHTNRKKAKTALNESSDDDGTSESDAATKVIVLKSRPIETAIENDPDADFDLLPSTYPRHGKHHRSVSPPVAQHDQSATVIDLPDKLRDVLALDEGDTKTTDREVEKIFQTLVYGRRVSHYDPKKGEIWDVGEDEEDGIGKGNPYGEDDEWEGEPVPWEVGEL